MKTSARPLTTSITTCVLAFALHGALEAQEDPYIWLEEVESAEALAWAAEQNAETRSMLRASPQYQTLFDQTVEIITSPERIAFPAIRDGQVHNLWTDANNPRGLYRMTSLDSYLSGDPSWETIVDIDALAEAEDVPWVMRGGFGNRSLECLGESARCMLSLSRGGADATVVREFDRATGGFIDGGFSIPEGKTSIAWVDDDHLLVATSADGEPVTTSGYAKTAKLWKRGTPFSSAEVVYEVDRDDMLVTVSSIRTPDGREPTINHLRTIFEGDTHIYRDETPIRLDLPGDAQTVFAGDHVALSLVSPWTVDGKTYESGTLVAVEFGDAVAGVGAVTQLYAPDDRSTISGVTATQGLLYVNVLTDVQSRLLRFRHTGSGWEQDEIDVPAAGAVSFVSNSSDADQLFFTYSSFIQPTTLFFIDEDGDVVEVDRLSPSFDANGLVVDQNWATSADGTSVPYFVVRHGDAPMDGTNPTFLTAYGGFNISRTPSYLGVLGKNWVEAGGVYVLANIRGGGEFGPEWWTAALKENRQRAYDDFIAVAEDLIERGITSPEHLGISGGSNGGLLVGAAMTQRPDLFNAVVVAVPLLDMKRYHMLLAGASWMAEYGNPDIPEEWAYISEYSPYQNLREGVEYPEPFIWTTTRDDRVHPGHARKMTARMQEMALPVIYFENTEGGHGSGVTPEQQAEIQALTFSYLFQKLGRRLGTDD